MALVAVPDCNMSQPVTVQDVKKVFAEANDVISSCSYGKMSINLNQVDVSACCTSLNSRRLSPELKEGTGPARDLCCAPFFPQVVPVNLTCTPAVRSAFLTCDSTAMRALATEALGNPNVSRTAPPVHAHRESCSARPTAMVLLCVILCS